jgi:protein SCO1/2
VLALCAALALVPRANALASASEGAGAQPHADHAGRPAPPLDAAEVEERLGRQLPLELVFRDEEGRAVLLGSAFREGRPVLLVMAYTRCGMLCPLVLHGLAAGVRGMGTPPGERYRVLTVSIDPRDTPAEARKVAAELRAEAGLAAGTGGWAVWTGEEEEVRALADALGFRYRYDAQSDQYAHPAAAFVLTPEGKISRYLYGVEFPSAVLESSLSEARQGRSVSSLERVLLRCFHYVPALRRYGAAVEWFVRSGGALVLISLGALFVWMRRREPRKEGAA